MKKLPLLGDITPAQFLRDYWHKKPLLIRNAVPGFKPLLSVDALAKLAATNHAESRLVTGFDGEWSMQHGPLESLPARDKRMDPAGTGRQPVRRQGRCAAAPVPLPARCPPGRPDGQLCHRWRRRRSALRFLRRVPAAGTGQRRWRIARRKTCR
jgi:hypothetical protein